MSVLTPIVNAGLLYVNGLQLSFTSTTAIAISSGQCRDSTNVNDIISSTSLAINTAVSGAGGLDTGTIAATSTYAVYMIASSRSLVPTAGIISLSGSAPLLPFDYDMYRRVGYVLTDGASHILSFWTVGNGTAKTMWYDALISITTTHKEAFFTQSLAAAVPDGVGQTQVILNVAITPNAAGDALSFRPSGSSSTNGNVIVSGDVAAVKHVDNVNVVAAVSAGHVSIDYMDSSASDTIAINVAGYVDNL